MVGNRGCKNFLPVRTSGWRTAGPLDELATIAAMNGLSIASLWDRIDEAATGYLLAAQERLVDYKGDNWWTPFNIDVGLTGN